MYSGRNASAPALVGTERRPVLLLLLGSGEHVGGDAVLDDAEEAGEDLDKQGPGESVGGRDDSRDGTAEATGDSDASDRAAVAVAVGVCSDGSIGEFALLGDWDVFALSPCLGLIALDDFFSCVHTLGWIRRGGGALVLASVSVTAVLWCWR